MHLRREVLLFALAMQRQLDAHAHRGESWKAMSPLALYNQLQSAVFKLDSALSPRDPAQVQERAADAANMAMMIWDVQGGTKQEGWNERAPLQHERARELLVDLHAELSDQLARSERIEDPETIAAGLAMCLAELVALPAKAQEQGEGEPCA